MYAISVRMIDRRQLMCAYSNVINDDTLKFLIEDEQYSEPFFD